MKRKGLMNDGLAKIERKTDITDVDVQTENFGSINLTLQLSISSRFSQNHLSPHPTSRLTYLINGKSREYEIQFAHFLN